MRKTPFSVQGSAFSKRARTFLHVLKAESRKLTAGNRGFTLLLAALVAAIVLSIASAIFSIAIKQVDLASAGQLSQFAFYTADSASECALYWDTRSDIHPNTFATSSADTSHATQITCEQQTIPLSTPVTVGATTTTTFWYAPQGYCAKVTVEKGIDAANNTITTLIRADGYSTTIPSSQYPQASTVCLTQIQSDAEALQRSIELQY